MNSWAILGRISQLNAGTNKSPRGASISARCWQRCLRESYCDVHFQKSTFHFVFQSSSLLVKILQVFQYVNLPQNLPDIALPHYTKHLWGPQFLPKKQDMEWLSRFKQYIKCITDFPWFVQTRPMSWTTPLPRRSGQRPGSTPGACASEVARAGAGGVKKVVPESPLLVFLAFSMIVILQLGDTSCSMEVAKSPILEAEIEAKEVEPAIQEMTCHETFQPRCQTVGFWCRLSQSLSSCSDLISWHHELVSTLWHMFNDLFWHSAFCTHFEDESVAFVLARSPFPRSRKPPRRPGRNALPGWWLKCRRYP